MRGKYRANVWSMSLSDAATQSGARNWPNGPCLAGANRLADLLINPLLPAHVCQRIQLKVSWRAKLDISQWKHGLLGLLRAAAVNGKPAKLE
jgi:hypothetical protein